MDCTNKNCPAYAKCLAPYRGSRCKATRATYGLGDPITEYDRIVRKSPEELAQWIMSIEPAACPFRDDHGDDCRFTHCEKCWLDFLKQEATNA